MRKFREVYMNNLGITCRRKTKFLLLFSTFAFACIVLITIKQVTEQGGNTFFSSFCQCTRNLSEDNVKKTGLHWCSEETTLRGFNQNVVSYTLYGDHENSRRYFGILETIAKQAKFHYPGWRIRFYHGLKSDTSEERRLLCHVYCNYDNVDLCHVDQLISSIAAAETNRHKEIDLPVTSWELIRLNRMNWRYIPMMDEQVDRMIARDADSEINSREAAAVSEWLESGFTFHVMRDHPSHKRAIMGGTFGVKVYKRRGLLKNLTKSLIAMGSKEAYNEDQKLLFEVFWPSVKEDAVIHDSYHCEDVWNSIPISPFPTQRIPPTIFVTDRNGSHWPRPTKCPYACRPTEHKDWEFC